MTGAMYAGKDHTAIQLGCRVVGFADPIYRLAENFFGTSNKELPGMRRWMQDVGQWGRGRIDGEYPLTPERAAITHQIRTWGHLMVDYPFDQIDWDQYGRTEDFWLDALETALGTAVGSKEPLAVTNARFPNEVERLHELGFKHVHVMASISTRTRRRGEPFKPDELRNISEQLALGFDALALGEPIPEEAAFLVSDVPDEVYEDVKDGSAVVWNDSEPIPESLEEKGVLTLTQYVEYEKNIRALT